MMEQKVLGLDLAKVTMTEAIAAMVDAWLDAQGVDDELQRPQDPVLAQVINYILSTDVEIEQAKRRSKIKISKLLEIRSRQTQRSSASIALYRAGIAYRNYKGKEVISINSGGGVFSGLSQSLNERWRAALLDAPGARYVEAISSYSACVELPAKYFWEAMYWHHGAGESAA